MSPRKVDRAERRREILTAAVRVFGRDGYATARIDDIAAEAGIAKGSVYLYFESRDALLEAASEAYRAAVAVVFADAVGGPGPALDRLARLVRTVVGRVAAKRDLARILIDLWAAGRAGTGSPIDMAGVLGDYRAAVSELLRQAEAEGTLRAGVGASHAAVVVGAIEGCLLQCLVDPAMPAADLAEPIIEVCLDGLRRPPAG